MGCSGSKISRLETGHIGSSPHDVREILTLYHVDEQVLHDLTEVAGQTRLRGWWQRENAVLTSDFVAFEQAAASIRSYEAQCVPGLLQTEEYARALLASGGATAGDIERRVHVRMRRRSLLTLEEPVDFWCVIDEAALLRPVGGEFVMRHQVEQLAMASEMENVTLQVLPMSAGAHMGMEGSFVLLRFPDDSDPDAVYVTMATGGVFQEKPHELKRYRQIFDGLTQVALPPGDSTALLYTMAKESG